MGFSCQINLQKTPEGLYRPGGDVNGVVKYIIDEPTVFSNIVVSLKGKGKVDWSVPGDDSKIYYSNFEEYVTINKSLLDNILEEGTMVSQGMYTSSFSFILPTDIPSTYNDYNCKIIYYVSVKFVKAAVFNSTKKFKVPLTVLSPVTPLLSAPLSTSASKVMSTLFKKSGDELKFSATASKNYLVAGEDVDVKIVVENDTGIDIKKINVYIIESITFTSKRGMTHSKNRKIKDCKKTIDIIPRNKINEFFVTVPSAVGIYSIQNSQIFSRKYKVLVVLKLPLPHRNVSSDIPLVIEDSGANTSTTTAECIQADVALSEGPPPYWKVVEEDKNKCTKKE